MQPDCGGSAVIRALSFISTSIHIPVSISETACCIHVPPHSVLDLSIGYIDALFVKKFLVSKWYTHDLTIGPMSGKLLYAPAGVVKW